jgi:hypothetical protein
MYWERDLSSIDELLDKLKQFGQHGLLNLLTKLLIVNVKDGLDCQWHNSVVRNYANAC